jgi:hypothetical protein
MPDTTDNGYLHLSSHDGPEFAPYPGYIQTPEQRERWDICAAIMSTMSSQHEPTGRPDPRFVWVGTRALYNTDAPMGEATPETTTALAELRKQRQRGGRGPL